MSYEFKKLSDVELVESTTDETKVLIEENGEIKKVAKSEVGGLNLNKIELAETATDESNVLIEEEGTIKRVPKTAVGGAGEVELPIFQVVFEYDYNTESYSCRQTFDEVQTAFHHGKFVYAALYMLAYSDFPSVFSADTLFYFCSYGVDSDTSDPYYVFGSDHYGLRLNYDGSVVKVL